MFRVGLVGLDSSHAYAFTDLFNDESAPAEKRVYGARVVAAWDGNRTDAEKYSREYRDVEMADSPEGLHPLVDTVMVLYRDGDLHLRYAKPFLKAGMPVFVDKPIARSLGDAVEMVRLAEEKRAPFMSCSALRYAVEIGALKERMKQLGEPRAGVSAGPGELIFYGVHAAEIAQTVFGPGVEYVYSVGDEKKDVALARYGDGKTVCLQVLRDATPGFHIVVYCEKGMDQAVVKDPAFYRETLNRYVEMLETKRPPIPYEWTLEVLKMLLAAKESSRTGRPAYLKDLAP